MEKYKKEKKMNFLNTKFKLKHLALLAFFSNNTVCNNRTLGLISIGVVGVVSAIVTSPTLLLKGKIRTSYEWLLKRIFGILTADPTSKKGAKMQDLQKDMPILDSRFLFLPAEQDVTHIRAVLSGEKPETVEVVDKNGKKKIVKQKKERKYLNALICFLKTGQNAALLQNSPNAVRFLRELVKKLGSNVKIHSAVQALLSSAR